MTEANNSIYNRPEAYELHFTDRKRQILNQYYQRVFKDKEIKTIHDCSYGTGNLTDELAKMGYTVSGSDISLSMIQQAQKNNKARGLEIELIQSDFRKLSENIHQQFDCVMSTGNSLAHVPNEDVKLALGEMCKLVKDGGYIYIDTRNWDRILESGQRFYYYPPVFNNEERVNTMQVWDYNLDGSITFNLLYSYEKNNEIYKREEFKEIYHPLKRQLLLDELAKLGFKEINTWNFIHDHIKDFKDMEWYVVMAQKG